MGTFAIDPQTFSIGVLLLRIVGGLNAEEVAAATGRGAWAVRALQRRGLLALRKKIALQAVQL